MVDDLNPVAALRSMQQLRRLWICRTRQGKASLLPPHRQRPVIFFTHCPLTTTATGIRGAHETRDVGTGLHNSLFCQGPLYLTSRVGRETVAPSAYVQAGYGLGHT